MVRSTTVDAHIGAQRLYNVGKVKGLFKGFGGKATQSAHPGARRPPRPQIKRPLFTISPSTKRMLITAAIIFGLIIIVFATAAFWVQLWWFDSMGFRSVLARRYAGQSTVFVIGTVFAAVVFLGNVSIALRRSRQATTKTSRLARIADQFLVALALVSATVISVGTGLAAAAKWDAWLLWWYSDPFGIKDPVFGRDVGFFIFAIPPLTQAVNLLLVLTLFSIVAALVVYALRLGVDLRQIRNAPSLMRVHVLSLAGFVLLLLAVKIFLSNYLLAYSTRGAAFGAGYTDVHIQRPANWALAAVALAIGGALVANAFVQRIRLLVGSVIAWGVLYVVVAVFIPSAVQSTVVEPSELKREREYIANNIEMTRSAYGLDLVDGRDLTGQAPLTEQVLASYPETLDNVRLWDYRIIQGTYQQLQSFVPYYVFLDVDVDRYIIGGVPEQVLLSAREIDQDGLPATAQTWTNERLVYTHGYGAVVSPVEEVSRQGLPVFLVERIPPTGQGVYLIERPEIYFGEADLGWVAVNTEQPEFSGLIDSDDPSSELDYQGLGKGSIRLDNYFKKLLLAAELQDRNLLLSGNLSSKSRILLHRNIVDRVETIAPFLELDPDPYLVIADGRLLWVIDAYTSTDLFPHASRIDGINYLKNSVKVVIDAYDGTVTFYRTSEEDPIADAYGKLYGDLFRPISEVPASISVHFRYPERLFEIQSDIYASVHVDDPTAFYNGEDFWEVPQEQVSDVNQRMVPYYVTMTLPGESATEFALIRPFIPGGRSQRQNMTAWMAGRVGADGSTSLIVYRFPRQETVFGPSQIEARINQEPDISAQITLWSQSGSRVLRGNLLVIPIGESVLYVQPLYLQAAAAEGALPELKRVIVASSERVVMAETLPAALSALVSAEPGSSTGTELEPATQGGTTIPDDLSNPRVQDLVAQAVEAYDRGQAALAAGDWAAYGIAQSELAQALDNLELITSQSESPSATPVASPAADE